MIYIPTGTEDVYENFALEYYFAVEHPLPEPVLLFWRTTPTLMVGKYQNTLEEINLPYVQAHGIHVARRLSGGGTIYTDAGAWQYSFLTEGADGIDFRAGVGPVMAALQALGVPVEWGGRNDLLIQGRKVSGTAQYQQAGHTVHHGSLLFDADLEQMVAATRVDPQKLESKGIASVRSRVVNLKEYLPDLDPCSFRDAMLSRLHPEGPVYQPTATDWARIRELAQERFRGWENIYGRDPRCSLEKSHRFPAGKVTLRLSLRHGVITEAALVGDFFAGEAAGRIAGALAGCPLTREAVAAALAPYDGVLYGISAAELTALAVE